MCVMMNAGTPPPFEERFGIEVGAEEARQRFINRIFNVVFNELSEQRLAGRRLPSASVISNFTLTSFVANELGEMYNGADNQGVYVGGDFQRCLKILEALYEALQIYGLEEYLSSAIEVTLGKSEVDLGV